MRRHLSALADALLARAVLVVSIWCLSQVAEQSVIYCGGAPDDGARTDSPRGHYSW